jgi:hypothetical protein
MNKAQLKKLIKKAGVKKYEIRGGGGSLEIEVSARDSKKLRKAGLPWGGYKTGYGAWVLHAPYVPKGDYMDKGSRWHA